MALFGFGGEVGANSACPMDETGTTRGERLHQGFRGCEGHRPARSSDDSGLCIDALDGDPGVYTRQLGRKAGCADFGNGHGKAEAAMQKAARCSRSSARALRCRDLPCLPDGEAEYYRGEVRAICVEAAARRTGFGYDPVFLPDG